MICRDGGDGSKMVQGLVGVIIIIIIINEFQLT